MRAFDALRMSGPAFSILRRPTSGAVSASSTVRIAIPLTNLFSVDAVNRLIQQASERKAL
jgi:hypothetical protein